MRGTNFSRLTILKTKRGGSAPLHIAILSAKYDDVFELLKVRGADIERPDGLGLALLHIAASSSGYPELA